MFALVYRSTLMAYYNYLVLVGTPACMYSQYVHMHLILYLRGEKKKMGLDMVKLH
jgi:hypothetical protein